MTKITKFLSVTALLLTSWATPVCAEEAFVEDPTPTETSEHKLMNNIDQDGLDYMQTDEYKANMAKKEMEVALQGRTAHLSTQLTFNWRTQETSYWCVPACSQILIEKVTGRLYSQSDLASRMGSSPSHGTYVNRAAPVIKQLTGANYEYTSNQASYFLPNVKTDIANGYPVIYFVDAGYFYNGYTVGTGHAVLGVGYQDNLVSFYDPNPVSQFNDIWQISAPDMSTALNANDGGYYIW